MNDGFIRESQAVMTEELRSDLVAYGEDVLLTKFPSYMDGLKDVTRRIVWASKEYKEPKGLNKLMGDIMDIHTSGDSSVYGAIIRCAQSFMVGNPLITVEGKSGQYSNPGAAAAPRYLKANASEFTRDVYFRGIHLKTIQYTHTKDFTGLEPKYLIPKIPMALVLGNLTVGFGFKSYIPPIHLGDVCDLVMEYANYYQNGNFEIPPVALIAKHLLPRFPIKNLIKNKAELLKNYKAGNFNVRISVEGYAEISGNSITLRTVPYGTDFGRVVSTIRELMAKDRKHWINNLVKTTNNYSSDTSEFVIEIHKGLNPFEVFDRLKSILNFTDSIHPIYNYTKQGRAIYLVPPTLVYLWYQERGISIAGGLKYRQAELMQKRMELDAMLIVSDHSDEVVSIIKSSDDDGDAIAKLHARFEQLTYNQAKIVASQRLTILAKANRKQIEAEIEHTENELKNIMISFSRIHQTIYTDAKTLKKKYNTSCETYFSDEFIGYVQFGKMGISHFRNHEEMTEILNTKGWPSTMDKAICYYQDTNSEKMYIKNGKFYPLPELSTHIDCEGIVEASSSRYQYTLVIRKDDGSTSILEKQVNGMFEDFTLCPITKEFYGIHRNGSVTLEKVDNYSIRKTVCSGAKTDLIYALPSNAKNLIVVHANTEEINEIRIDKILTDKLSVLKTLPTGEMSILGIYPENTKRVVLNIPSKFRKNIGMEHLIIENINGLVQHKPNTILSLSKSSGISKQIKRDSAVRSLYYLKVPTKEQ